MSPKCYVVTEGADDVALLEAVLGSAFSINDSEIKLVSAGGWSGADSVARSLLVSRKIPVALVVDADSPDASERQEFLESMFRLYADASRWKVLVIAPQTEAVLFESSTLLSRITGHSPTRAQMQRGIINPKPILDELLQGETRVAAYGRINEADAITLLKNKPLKELVSFLERFATNRLKPAARMSSSRRGGAEAVIA